MATKTTTSKVTKKKRSAYQVARAKGFRSGLEVSVASQLESLGLPVVYEAADSKISYRVDELRKYTPDFVLPNGIIIETKGLFTSDDRKKHLLIKAQHPQKDIRFVFTRASTRLSKTSKTTYACWCNKHGYLWADRLIPDTWLKE